jgi:hypothetical protein
MKNRIHGLTALPLGLALVLALALAGCPQPNGSDGGDGAGSALTGTVTIDGKLLVGEVLTANISALNGEGAASYQWQRGNAADGEFSAIENAGEASYTLADGDNGKYVRVEVSRVSYSGTKTSAARGPVSVDDDDEEVNKDQLVEAITAATAAKNAALTVAESAREVPYGTTWTTQSAIDDYEDAIAAAQAVVDNEGSTQAEVDAALAALDAATTAFEAASQDGLLFTGEDAIENLREYLDGKDQNTTANPYPVYLEVAIAELEGTATKAGTQDTYTDPLGYLLDALTRFVALDLSACTGTSIGNFQMDTSGTDYRPNRDNVVSVVLPSGVTNLGNYAFQYFGNLTTVVLPDGLTAIRNGVFQYCGALTTINLPGGLYDWYNSVFEGTGLGNIVLPNPSNLDIGGGSLFSDCPNLESVTFPSNTKAIGTSVFGMTESGQSGATKSCPNLRTIIIERWNPEASGTPLNGKITTIPTSMLYNSSQPCWYVHPDVKIYVPNAVAKEFYKAAANWKDIPNIASKLTYIGEGE